MKSIKLLKFTVILYALSINAAFADSWTPLNSGTNAWLTSIYFVDPNTGFAVGDSTPGEYGVILKTTDGGISWIKVYSLSPTYLNSVYFSDANNGIVTGGYFEGYILKTTDGGTNWTSPQIFTDYTMSLSFIDENIGYGLAGKNKVLHTTNMFNTWDTLTINNTKALEDILFMNALEGFVVGQGGTILKTFDGGENWRSCLPYSVNNYNSINFPDWEAIYVFSSAQSIIEKSTDGGDSWNTQILPNENYLRSVCFTDANTGYAVGDGGTILKTIDGGNSWVPEASGTENDLYYIRFFGNIGYIVGGNGTILKYIVPSLPSETNEHTTYIEIKSYPNPTTELCEITLTEPLTIDYKIELFNSMGSLIQTSITKNSEYSVQVDLSEYPAGIYLIRLRSNRQWLESKIVKQ